MPGHFLGSNAADWGSEFGAITIDLFNGTDSSQKEQFISSVSKLSGVLSLSVWLFAQLPQIIENHLNESVSGVSLLFLLCWIGGDTTNLLGCILTKALPFQTSLAAYYCFIDCILSLQYWYYTRVFPKHRIHHNLLQSPNMLRPTTSRKSARHSTRRNRFEDDVNRSPMQITISHNVHTPHQESFIHKILGASFISSSLGKQAQSMPVPIKDATVDIVVNTARKSSEISRKIISNPFTIAINNDTEVAVSQAMLDDSKTWLQVIKETLTKIFIVLSSIPAHTRFRYSPEEIGKISAWTCTVLYISSRAPQIIKNHKSGSTKGISVYLFLFAMLGNVFYTISIVSDLYLLSLNKVYMGEGGDSEFNEIFMDQLPFIVGSAGTVCFDMVILFQCWLYSDNSSQSRRSSCSSDFYVNGHHHNSYGSIYNDEYDDMHSPGHKRRHKSRSSRSKKRSSDSRRKHSRNRNKRESPSHFPTDWYNGINVDLKPTNIHSIDEATSLNGNAASFHMTSPPPSHYISASHNRSIQFDSSMTNSNGKIGGAITAIARSLSHSGSYIGGRGRSPNSFHSNSYIAANQIPSSGGFPANSPLMASLIPSIIGNYSSVSKKMSHESKIPFSPIDFLSDDFYRPGSASVGSLGHGRSHSHGRSDSHGTVYGFYNPPTSSHDKEEEEPF